MSWAIWITGLPGSGKSTLACGLATELAATGEPVTVLELDALRKALTPSPTYSDTERELVYRALVAVTVMLTRAGVPVIIDATGHRRQWRDLARAAIPTFAEIQLTCPVNVCRERERRRSPGNAPPGIYAGAGRPGATVPGVNVPYEPALHPLLVVHTALDDAAAVLMKALPVARALARSAKAEPRPDPAPRWAMWITGLPGSGKSTLADAAAERLARGGIAVQVLDLTEIRHFMAPAAVSAAADEIAHRALVCASRLLAEAGKPVIIDATAPHRAWRQMARAMIAHFAEVQLLCPPEVCDNRERAVRWRSHFCGHAVRAQAATCAAPDIVLGYEASLNPELTIHTNVRDIWSATEEIVSLAHRLHRAAARSCLSA